MVKDISISIQEGMSKADNYNKLLFNNFDGFVGERILEIGCSIGNITKFFDHKELVIATDVLKEAIDIIKSKYSENKNVKTLMIDVSDEKIIELNKYKIDTIVCMNVLEHIEKDLIALENMNKTLICGGNLLLLVPAIKCIYGSVDESDHHFRRYSKKELRQEVENAGFKIKRLNYINLFGVVGWLINGKILKRKTVHQGMLSVFDSLVPLLFKTERLIGPPFGLSLVCVAEKYIED
jgi:2-polyprenyl-3-methyl-5-hydroxy-6-metoxy-1,4-benzoquinol methylase